MTDFYSIQRPAIENGKLILISNGLTRSPLGIRRVRQQIKEIESKANIRPSTQARLTLLREAAAVWDNYKAAE